MATACRSPADEEAALPRGRHRPGRAGQPRHAGSDLRDEGGLPQPRLPAPRGARVDENQLWSPLRGDQRRRHTIVRPPFLIS